LASHFFGLSPSSLICFGLTLYALPVLRHPARSRKTSYFDDEDHRRYIGRHLTRHESRHKLARTVFHGRKGQLRQPYREGMEDQLGALGLVVNVMVLWTTLYMDRGLDQLRGLGATVNDEDVARLSPLGTNHINVYLDVFSRTGLIRRRVVGGVGRSVRRGRRGARRGAG
jgi:hypothetical protein